MTLISFYCGKRSAAPWCLESRKAQFPNVACAWRVFPNAILLLGIGYKTFKTLFPDIGRSWTICKVGRLLCRRTPHSAMVLLFICQDPNCLFYPQMPRWYKWSLFLLKFSVDYILLHISFLDYSFWNSTSSFHFASKFCHTFLSFKDGNMLFCLSETSHKFIYPNFYPLSVLYLQTHLLSFSLFSITWILIKSECNHSLCYEECLWLIHGLKASWKVTLSLRLAMANSFLHWLSVILNFL